tara:strand:+ start:3149 stop:4255 length:1107 start_codon:yes stop_codon:yes gene_type:complete
MNWIRIISINFIVFLGLLILIEMGLRLAWTGYSCFFGDCDYERLTNIKIYDVNNGFSEKYIGLSEYDNLLGYKPNSGFKGIINAAGWNDKLVTINKKGFRLNDNGFQSNDLDFSKKILAIGDSFTFGDQVNNHETWPACVEKKTNLPTSNAGVFGYGSAQAVRRASRILIEENFNTIILSILLYDDFYRDQLIFRSGFPRPAVLNVDGNLIYSKVPDENSRGTKWNPSVPRLFLISIKNRSMLGARIIDSFRIDLTGMRRTEIHPEAASIDEIISFTIGEFNKIKVNEKFIVLQYGSNDLPNLSSKVSRLKNLVQLFSKENGIKIIDTFNVLKDNLSAGRNMIWQGHHTPYGNMVVCEEISKYLKNKK